MAHRSNLKPASGTARQDRFLPALDPASAKIDERTYEDLMTFALDFSRLLNFYDSTNQPAGDWHDFFKRDLSFLLARIVTTDFQKDNHKGWALQNAVKAGRENTKEILKAVYDLAKRLDGWYAWAKEVPLLDRAPNIPLTDRSPTPVRENLEDIIRDVRPHLREIPGILEKLRSQRGDIADYWTRLVGRLQPLWHETDGDDPALAVVYDSPMDGLLAILRTLHLANDKLRNVAAQYLDEFKGRSDHPPHTALYLAFAKLLLQLQVKLNNTTEKHLDFYYRDVLRLRERDSSPDQAYVSFDLAPELPRFDLPKGARLAAGKDAKGTPIEYSTDEDLFLNHARVASVKALYLAKNSSHLAPEVYDRVVNIFALPEANSEDGRGAPLKSPGEGWATFGIDEATDDANGFDLPAELGFVAASTVLLLEEGERNVIVTIAFAGDGKLEEALQTYQTAANDILDAPPSIETLLSDAFCVHVSGAKGWMPLTGSSFRRHPIVGTAMSIEFTLRSTDPGITPNPAIAPSTGGSQWPMFKLALNPRARVYAYHFFKDLEIETIEFRVSVSGAQKVQLRNESGLLNPAQPFPAFGPTPAVGSYLLLSHPELTAKAVNHATLTVSWFNLPQPPLDLETYYAAYGLGIRDDSFKVRFSVFGSEKWEPPADGHDLFPMFARDYDRSGGLLPVTVFAAQMPEVPLPAAEAPLAPALSESAAPRGSIRLELAAPEFGFGQQVFPSVMAATAIKNAKAGKHGQPQPLPNPPFVPVAKALTLDYEASEKLDLTRPLLADQRAHFASLYPFGHLSHPGRPTCMFPRFEEQGHLYLGISDAGPRQPVTLLFQICDTAFSPIPSLIKHHDEKAKPLVWRYLSRHEWKKVPPSLLLSDSTMGLTRSGIVKISLPGDITSKSSLMPGSMCWIEVAAPQVAGVYWSRVVSIATQAVGVTRICDLESPLDPAVMPANSITQLVQKLPQVKAVRQPFPSSGGRSRETPHGFRARVSERLRHKDRAVQACDYERLVLENFPEVGQVKCVGYNNSRNFSGTGPVNPGTLYLVVTPRLEDTASLEPRLPQYVLKQIEAYVAPHASKFVEDIHVINPVYEALKVFATVEFSVEGDGSGYVDDLDAALTAHLQQWRFKQVKPMPIGSGQVQCYEVAKFIQQQKAYVRRLRPPLLMLHTYRTEDGYVSRWLSGEQRAAASAPWSVLIPTPHHFILPFDPDKPQSLQEGIPNLTVGSDLVVSPETEGQKKEEAPELRYFLVIPAHPTHGGMRR